MRSIKCAEKIFIAGIIDSRFASDSRIGLPDKCRRHMNKLHTSIIKACSHSADIRYYSPTKCNNDVRSSRKIELCKRIQNIEKRLFIFRSLAAFDDDLTDIKSIFMLGDNTLKKFLRVKF